MIESFLTWLLNRWQNRESLKLGGAKRSPHWGKVRAEHLKKFPVCEVCKKPDQLNVHHKIPFSQDKSKELSPENLITLCEAPGREHHLNFGHLGSYLSWNSDVVKDSAWMADKIKNRP